MQLKSVGASLSTRQLLRIARRMSAYPGESLYDILQKACLSKYVVSMLDNLRCCFLRLFKHDDMEVCGMQ